jgi:GNAT superfamily N-acetyltransferase
MRLKPLSPVTLNEAVSLLNTVFPQQSLFERASWALPLSLARGVWAKAILAIVGVAQVRYWVAMVEERVVGITGLYVVWTQPDAYWVGWTCVEPQSRGQGIGGKLLDFVIAQVRSEGKQVLRLYTSDQPGMAIAQKLYDSRGLKVVKEKQHCHFKRIYRELQL